MSYWDHKLSIIMSGRGNSPQDNYWMTPPQNQQYFDSNFGQPNQQFEFTNYDQQPNDYGAYPQQDYLNPNPNAYGGDLYSPDNYNQSL